MARKKPRREAVKPEPPVGRGPRGYDSFLGDLKERLRTAQLRASLAVNRELIRLYWQTGRDIVERQKVHRWCNAVLDRLGDDL